MGPSGSGKTSLLSIIGGRTPKMVRVQGAVLYNGKPLNKRAKRQVGYVMQDDLLYVSLTVWETLWFAAQLRLPRTMSKAAKRDRVNAVLAALGLTRCRDTIIGGYFRRGVSGGERKRVSVGHELLINPSMLLLDEPTSGLDSTTALQLVESLHSLAAGGRAIITTIHQPSARLYGLLDKLMLLADGRPLYYGKAGMAADWFHRLGYTLPYGTNVADYILDLGSGTVTSAKRSGPDSLEHLTVCSEKFLASDGGHVQGYQGDENLEACGVAVMQEPLHSRLSMEGGNIPVAAALHPDCPAGNLRKMYGKPAAFDIEAGAGPGISTVPLAPACSSRRMSASDSDYEDAMETASLDSRRSQPRRRSQSQTQPQQLQQQASQRPRQIRRTLTRMETFMPGRSQPSRWGATYLQQLRILFVRSLKTRRFESLSVQDMLQLVSVALLSGLFWFNAGKGRFVSDGANIVGLLFFELIFLAFRIMFTALFTFPNEYKMMLKERASGMYRLSAFYVARTASDLPMDCTIPSLFLIIVYSMAALRRTAGGFFANWAANMLVQLVAQAFGLLIGATVMDPKAAQTMTSVIMLTMMLVGGFYVTDLPSWISWMKYLSFIYYGYNLLVKVQFKGVTLYDCGTKYTPKDYRTNPRCTVVPPSGVQDKLSTPASPGEWPWEAIVLIGWLVFFRILVYVALRIKTKS